MTEKELQDRLSALELEHAVLQQKIAPIKQKMDSLYEKVKVCREKIAAIEVAKLRANPHTPSPGDYFSDEELAFVLVGDHHNMEKHRLAEQLITERIGCNHSIARYGYNPETMETTFRFHLIKNDPDHTKNVKEVLSYLIPRMKPTTFGERYGEVDKPHASFHIFERSLSQHGGYQLNAYSDTDFRIRHRYSRDLNFESLADALTHIENHIWYEDKRAKGHSSYYDDDDDS